MLEKGKCNENDSNKPKRLYRRNAEAKIITIISMTLFTYTFD